MSGSVSLSQWQLGSKSPEEVPGRFGIEPEVLLANGILRNPNRPDHAYLRAKSLVEKGHYREARALLHAHARTAPEPLRIRIADLLAQCAMHGGGDWAEQLGGTLLAYRGASFPTELALTHQRLGDMQLLAGAFTEADENLSQATTLFVQMKDLSRAARVECLRARSSLRAGRVIEAQTRIDRLIATLEKGDPRTQALARLERARILACRGDAAEAARDLVLAERVLGVSGNAADRMQTRLVRAEALITLGDGVRAAAGLKRVMGEAVSLEEVATRAAVHALFGQALLDVDPGQARRQLMRARHLYESVSAEYAMAFCDVLLARCDHRLGLNARGRLKAISREQLERWPLIRAHVALARAEVHGREDPERARSAILRARAFAATHGNASLVRMLDAVLVEQQLIHPELDEITPIDQRSLMPVTEVGSSDISRALNAPPPPPRGPTPQLAAVGPDATGCRVASAPTTLAALPAPEREGSALRPPLFLERPPPTKRRASGGFD